jgi:hypothetical protein
MTPLREILAAGVPVESHRPWPRVGVSPETWDLAGRRLAEGRLILLGLWGEADAVHMALLSEEPLDIGVITLESKDGAFPSVGAWHPPAIRLERTIRDVYGLRPVGLPDQRPWLDHGRWDVQHPLGVRTDAPSSPAPYPFLKAEGESLHQIPVGPVHAGIIEPGHFRFTASGEMPSPLRTRSRPRWTPRSRRGPPGCAP